MRMTIGTMTKLTSLDLEEVMVDEPVLNVIMYSHRTHGRRPAEWPAAAGLDSRGIKATETELDKKKGQTIAGTGIRTDKGTMKTGHPKKNRGGQPAEGRKFAEVVNRVHMFLIILSLKFLTHRMYPTTNRE